MRPLLRSLPFLATAACGSQPTPPPHPAPAPESAAETALPMCAAQRGGDAAELPRSGEMREQLAPSYFESMARCDLPMPDVSGVADGTINEDGDCEFHPGVDGQKFVSCHYHLGVEFAHRTTLSQPGYGEIHCIFPNADGPTVFGGYFQCSNQGHRPEHPPHDKFAGASCPASILQELKSRFDACGSEFCCDDGTLTGPESSRSGPPNALLRTVNRDLGANLRNALPLRPDFRICGEPMQLDCDQLAMWAGHKANCPHVGGVTDTAFAPTLSPAAERSVAEAKKDAGAHAAKH